MLKLSRTCLGLCFVLLADSVLAQNLSSVGGDVFVGGSKTLLAVDSPRDVFAAGFSVSITGDVGADAHAAGFDVTIDAPIGADLYATGSNVTVGQSVRDDLSVSGFTVKLLAAASVGGNARIAAGSLTIDAPIAGSLVASAGNIDMNSHVGGDVRISAAELDFGPDALVDGTLTYSGPKEIKVPAFVAPATRVRYQPTSAGGVLDDVRDTIDDSVGAFWPSVFNAVTAMAITLAFLLLVATLFLVFTPERLSHLRTRASHASGRALLFGCLGLATAMGLIPVSVITIVGLPLIPILILAIILLWLLGYLLGAHLLSLKLFAAFTEEPTTTGSSVIALALVLLALSLLNFIPVAGWMINLAVMLYGAGLISLALLDRLSSSGRAVLPQHD